MTRLAVTHSDGLRGPRGRLEAQKGDRFRVSTTSSKLLEKRLTSSFQPLLCFKNESEIVGMTYLAVYDFKPYAPRMAESTRLGNPSRILRKCAVSNFFESSTSH